MWIQVTGPRNSKSYINLDQATRIRRGKLTSMSSEDVTYITMLGEKDPITVTETMEDEPRRTIRSPRSGASNMRRLWVLIVAALVLWSGAAAAQSLPKTADWSGFYFGGTIGTATGVETYSFLSPPGVPVTITGTFGGVNAEYDKQLGALVFGLDASLEDGRISGKNTTADAAPCRFTPCPTTVEWFGTVNGKVGYEFNNLIEPYVEFGLATGGISGAADRGACVGDQPPCSYNQQGSGVDFGAGVAVAVSKLLVLKLEADHVDLGKPKFTPQLDGSATDVTFNAVKLTADLHF